MGSVILVKNVAEAKVKDQGIVMPSAWHEWKVDDRISGSLDKLRGWWSKGKEGYQGELPQMRAYPAGSMTSHALAGRKT